MKRHFLLFLLLIVCMVLFGCSKSTEEPLPELTADVTLVGNSFILTWDSDININVNNIGKDHVIGQGYAMLYVDDNEGILLKGKNGIDLNVKEGIHKVTIELFKNNGESYNVKRVFENVGL